MKRNAIIIGLVLFSTSCAYGLGQRLAVKYIRAIAATAELTPTQAENLTPQQAKTYILANYPSIPAGKLKEASTYWPAIKRLLYRDAVGRAARINETAIKKGMENLFPDVAFDWGELETSRAVRRLSFVSVGSDPNAF